MQNTYRLRACIVVYLVLVLFGCGGGGGTGSESISSNAAKLSWDSNSDSDLAGYKIYYGTAPRTYGNPIDVRNTTTSTVPDLQKGVRYYFAVTAYDTSGNESGYSSEVSKAIP